MELEDIIGVLDEDEDLYRYRYDLKLEEGKKEDNIIRYMIKDKEVKSQKFKTMLIWKDGIVARFIFDKLIMHDNINIRFFMNDRKNGSVYIDESIENIKII